MNIRDFEIESGVVQLLPKYHGIDKKGLYLHLHEFEEICATISLQNISTEELKLKFVLFYLKDKAKIWLHSLRQNSIGRYDDI